MESYPFLYQHAFMFLQHKIWALPAYLSIYPTGSDYEKIFCFINIKFTWCSRNIICRHYHQQEEEEGFLLHARACADEQHAQYARSSRMSHYHNQTMVVYKFITR